MAAPGQVDKWGTCGGITTTGANSSDASTCCPRGYECQWYTDYHWQCMPVGMTESNKPVGTWDKTCTGTKVSGQNLMPTVTTLSLCDAGFMPFQIE